LLSTATWAWIIYIDRTHKACLLFLRSKNTAVKGIGAFISNASMLAPFLFSSCLIHLCFASVKSLHATPWQVRRPLQEKDFRLVMQRFRIGHPSVRKIPQVSQSRFLSFLTIAV
jgi:hypothetical protein